MVEEQGTATEAQREEHGPTSEESPPQDQQQRTETPTGEATGAEPASDWTDLDAYRAQLRTEHAAWAERVTLVQTQLASVRPAVLGIASQYRALGIEEDLERLNETILAGAAMVQTVRLAFDLERYVTLVWPVAGDPRPEMAQEDGEGEYRIEIWLHVGPDGRGRIRVEGAKKLEALLPTTRERLRRVLLSTLQAPRYVPPPTTAEAEEGTEQERTQAPPASDEQPVEEASPRPGDPEEQPPPEEQVIPLGPSGGTEETKPGSEA